MITNSLDFKMAGPHHNTHIASRWQQQHIIWWCQADDFWQKQVIILDHNSRVELKDYAINLCSS